MAGKPPVSERVMASAARCDRRTLDSILPLLRVVRTDDLTLRFSTFKRGAFCVGSGECTIGCSNFWVDTKN